MKKTIVALALLITAFFSGCETNPLIEPDEEAFGFQYYPLTVGDYRIYDVTNIRFMNNVGDTTRFQLRERVDSVYESNGTTINYKIVRSIRPNQNGQWVDDSVLLVTKNNLSIVEQKNNNRRVKLVFPVRNGKTWNADVFNSNTVESFAFTQVGEPFSIGGKTYDNTLTVIQGNPTHNAIILDDRKEVYAKEIGLVYRMFNKVTFCNDSEGKNCPYNPDNNTFKLNGHERIEILNSHGKM